MKIRKAKKEDMKEIAEIYRIGANKKPYFGIWTKKTALKTIKKLSEKSEFYVAENNGKIIGFIASHTTKRKKSYIDELWIKPKYQKKGIGGELMKLVEEKYKKRGIKSIRLDAYQNADAVKFYKKLNYQIEKVFLRMSKKLR